MSTTSRTKHTPGPWAAESEGSIVAVESGRDAGRVIVELARADGRSVGGTKAMDAAMEANARLIAAAPELLAALEAAIPALIRLGDFVGNVDPGGASGMGRIDRCALILQAREAIAKAKEV